MKTILKELVLVLIPIWLSLVLSACSKGSEAAPQVTQTALPPISAGQPAEIDRPNANDQPTEESWNTYTNLLFQVAF